MIHLEEYLDSCGEIHCLVHRADIMIHVWSSLIKAM